jgi:hypothetical protein
VGILHGAWLGAWHLGHGAIDGNGVARAALMDRQKAGEVKEESEEIKEAKEGDEKG